MQLLKRVAVVAAVACALFAWAPSVGYAQDAGSREPPAPADVRVDPETGERYRWVRPDEEVRRGAVQVPGWLVIAGGVAVAGAAAALLILRARRRG